MMPIGQFGVDGCHLIDDGQEPNVGLEITNGVGKVVVQESHKILELLAVALVSCDHVDDNICCWTIGR